MKNFALLAFAAVIFYLPKILGWIGIAGTSDDMKSWGQIMTDLGLQNFLALAVFAIAIYLFYQDWKERRETNVKERVVNSYFPSLISQWRNKILFYGPIHSIRDISHSSRDERETFIECLGILAKNNSKQPIFVRNCYVESTVTGERMPATIERKPIGSGLEIARNANFEIIAKLPQSEGAKTSSISGMGLFDFRKKWMGFKFVVECDGFKQEYLMPPDFVDWQIYEIFSQKVLAHRPDQLRTDVKRIPLNEQQKIRQATPRNGD